MTRRRIKSCVTSSGQNRFLSFISFYFKIFSVLVVTSTFIFYIASFPESASYFTDRSKSEVRAFSFTSNMTSVTYSTIIPTYDQDSFMDLEEADEGEKDPEKVDSGEIDERNKDVDQDKENVEQAPEKVSGEEKTDDKVTADSNGNEEVF